MTSYYTLKRENLIWPKILPGHIINGDKKFDLSEYNSSMCEPFGKEKNKSKHMLGVLKDAKSKDKESPKVNLNNKNTPSVPGNPNMILSKNLRLSTTDTITHLNNNMTVIADMEYVKNLVIANILQMHSSFVVNDVDGQILSVTEEKLMEAGYEVVVLDLKNGEGNVAYNPLKHIQNHEDAEAAAECIIYNFWQLTKNGKSSTDNIVQWSKVFACKLRTRVRIPVRSLVTSQKGELSDNAENGLKEDKKKSLTKRIMQIAENKNSEFNVKDEDVLIGFINQIDTNTENSNKEINLEDIGDRLTAVFIITDKDKIDADIYISLLMLQISMALVEHRKGLKESRRLPYHVQIYMNEINRIGKIPGFMDIIAYARAYNVSYTISDNSIVPLKNLYGDDYMSVLGNCDSAIICRPNHSSGFDECTAEHYAGMLERYSSRVKYNKHKWLNSIKRKNEVKPKELLQKLDKECIVFLRGHSVVMDEKITKKYL